LRATLNREFAIDSIHVVQLYWGVLLFRSPHVPYFSAQNFHPNTFQIAINML
jgi:hypothetical protein